MSFFENLPGQRLKPALGSSEPPSTVLKTLETVKKADIEKFMERVGSGESADPKLLAHVIKEGSSAERIALREAFASPAQVSRNQDLTLPYVADAISGKPAAREAYLAKRTIISENLPDWAAQEWQKEACAPWRTLNLHAAETARRFGRTCGAAALPQYRTITFGPFDSEERGCDIRSAFLTYNIGADVLKHAAHVAKYGANSLQWTKETRRLIADHEVRHGYRSINSPTPIGEFFRQVAERELNYLLTAFLLEDAALALDIPLNDEAKRIIWLGTRERPWQLAHSSLVVDSADALAALRGRGFAHEALEEAFSELMSDPRKLLAFQRELRGPKQPWQAPTVTLPEAPKPTSEPKESSAPSDTWQLRQARMALSIKSALETLCGRDASSPKERRMIQKLIDGSSQAFALFTAALERGETIESVIKILRANRPVSSLHREEGLTAEDEAPDSSDENSPANSAKQRQPPAFVYSIEAEKALTDGRVRHLVSLALDRFSRHPELADRRKINETSDVWELRLLGENFRIYYYHPKAHTTDNGNIVCIIFVGSKNSQLRDIPKLQAIRDREAQRLRDGI